MLSETGGNLQAALEKEALGLGELPQAAGSRVRHS